MRIYTGRGDTGRTDLRSGGRVSKTHSRIEAYGTVDEVNALIGTVRPTGYDDVDDRLRTVQNHLHIVQAALANPDSGPDDPAVTDDHIERLEAWMDSFDEELPALESFILPGGGTAGAKLHHARAVCRRAERRTVALADRADEGFDEPILVYLNRLSDALFVFARVVNARDGEREEAPSY